jgi:Family of unknown function (DUF695)
MDAFWSWWEEHGGEPGQLDALKDAVNAIDGGLEWELWPRDHDPSLLIVTAADDHALYATAARWAAAAPESDRWSFLCHRPRLPRLAGTLVIAGASFALSELRLRISRSPSGLLVDVVVAHPALAQLEPDAAWVASRRLLDAVVGEVAVERHVGEIAHAAKLRRRAVDAEELRTRVDVLADARSASRSKGIRPWSLLDTGRAGLPGILKVDRSLRHIDHPLLDARAEMTIQLVAPTPTGLVSDKESDALQTFLESILTKVNADPVAEGVVVISRETHAGARTITFAFDSTGKFGPWIGGANDWNTSWSIEVATQLDPAWDYARTLTTGAEIAA